MTSASDHDRTLNQLEWEAERTRAELMDTVEELRERVSPSHVKEDVKQYARSTGQDFVSNVVEKARENPVQAAAIAAAIAYPAWHMIRSIPIPVLLLSAGAVLAGQVGKGENGHSLASRFGLGSGDGSDGRLYEGSDDFSDDRGWQGTVERNPMLTTGLGLLVGVLLGGALSASGALDSRGSDEDGGMRS
jgi:ElaB/YqjD/DUF883 family membrane-anchored ribosome-binding protein